MSTGKSWVATGLIGLTLGVVVAASSHAAVAAAPAGATASLEEKVRKLEEQVKSLQQLLDQLRKQLVAGPTGGTRIAVVDLVRVFNEYEQTKVLNQKMSALEDELRGEDERKQAEVESQKNAAKAFATDSAEYKKNNETLKRLMIDYQVWKNMKQDEVSSLHLRWVNLTYLKVEKEVAALAKAKGFQLVITREELDTSVNDSKVMLKQIVSRKVIYSDPSVDLTDEVLTDLNAAFHKAGGAKAIEFNNPK